MHEEIRRIMAEISRLEGDLHARLREQEEKLQFTIRGRRVEFAEEIRAAHRRARVGLLKWLSGSDMRNVLSAPFVYGLVIPFALLDLFLCIYQAVGFRLYRLPPVPRSAYIVIDRQHLGYLNAIQKLNCVYCSYANGLISWAREIASMTEQYWCPIKHARKVAGAHARYAHFLDYGDAEAFEVKVQDLREELRCPPEQTNT
jgi:hypothetical protein